MHLIDWRAGLKNSFCSIQTCSWIKENNKEMVKVVGNNNQRQHEGSLFNSYYTTPFFGLLHFTLDTYLIILSVKEWYMKYSRPLANTLPNWRMGCSTEPLLDHSKLMKQLKWTLLTITILWTRLTLHYGNMIYLLVLKTYEKNSLL